MNNSEIEALAAKMNVSSSDLLCLANSTIESMKSDKVDGIFMESDDEMQKDLSIVYAQHAVNKFQDFTSTYFTRDGAREAFSDTVLEAL